MKCPQCQWENPPGSNFCLGCGRRLGATCGACGTDLPIGSRFCNKCGTHVSGGEPAGQARFASPDSYTPKHLAERILTCKTALEGERKQVTVLFADLKGSMEFLADRDPEEARKILDPVLEFMMEAVHRYEGTVNQVMGDGIMALFGAPLAHEDHAVRACYAALRMQDAVKRYAEDAHRAHGVNVQIRVGLNSGEVVVRAIGNDLHMDYTAVGQTTHLAARMEQLASPGSILLTPSTRELVEGFVAIKSLGPVPVKGLVDAVEICEVTGAGLVRTRLQAAAGRGLTRFVGRDTELEQLRRVQQVAANGHGQVAAIVGEAGMGKSRLVYEVTRSPRTAGWLVLEATAAAHARVVPYRPAIELLRTYFKLETTDGAREIAEKVTGRLLTLDRAIEPMVTAVLGLLDVPIDDFVWRSADPPERRRRIGEAVKHILVRESQVQPVCVVLEDLHWVDSGTQSLLDALVESLPAARLLLLVNYRPEYRHAWGHRSYYTQLRIDALAPSNADDLLDELLGDDTSLAPLKQLLVERTGGNPFFLEEMIRALVASGHLAGVRGIHRLTAPLEKLQTPPTVHALLAARIDRLPPPDKRLLQAAAVAGPEFTSEILFALVDDPNTEVHVGLARLKAAEFIYEASLFPEPEYAFKHVLTHEVAYESLLHEQRRALHARAMDTIERLHRERLIEHVDRLARHALAGEVWTKAVFYLRDAGQKAASRSANREAAVSFEQALRALEHEPESRARTELAIDLRFALRNVLHASGEFSRTLTPLREAEALAQTIDDERRLGTACAHLSQYFRLVDDLAESIELGQRALAIGTALDDLGLQLMARVPLGQAHHALGDYRRAIEVLRASVTALVGPKRFERFGQVALPSVMCRSWIVRSQAELGEFHEGATLGEEGICIAEEAGHPFSLVTICFGLGTLHFRRGDLSRAAALLDRGLGLARTWEYRSWVPPIASLLGLTHTLTGTVEEGLQLLEQAVEEAEAMGLAGRQGFRFASLAEGYLVAGRTEEANRLTRRALELSREGRERGCEAWTLRLLGELGAHEGSARAEDHYRQGVALAEELGMRPLVAHCHLGLANLHKRTGKRQLAQEHFATATAMYREMDMRFWLEKAEAELKA